MKKDIFEAGNEQYRDTIHYMFECSVDTNPDKIAVVFYDETITYSELNKKANQFAWFLRNFSINKNDVIVLMLRKSIDFVAAIIGVMKVGGAYLPIDIENPLNRNKEVLRESKAKLIITDSMLISDDMKDFLLDESNELGKTVFIDKMKNEINEKEKVNLQNNNCGNDLLYVIFTSGSTGKPKGVMLEHINLINLIRFEMKKTNIDFSGRVLQSASMAFDVSFQEIFSTLLSGGTLYIINNRTKSNISELVDYIYKNKVEILFFSPSFIKLIFNNEPYLEMMSKSVKHIIAAGEQLVISDNLRKYIKENNICLHNHYGPTETHVATTLTLTADDIIPSNPSIGYPISNNRIYILDENMQSVPVGVSGEIYIAGIGVGRGYLNQPELTQKSFFINPYRKSERIYKTGDFGKMSSDGSIVFLGRKDLQVKINGYRIELQEIEKKLMDMDGVKNAVVLNRDEKDEQKYLCAYLVLDKKNTKEEIRKNLEKELPYYMIPSYFLEVDDIPLNANGKVDQKRLLELKMPNKDKNDGLILNGDKKEIIANIWRDTLGVDSIDCNTGFFELGGNSILLAVVLEKINGRFHVNIPIIELYNNSTINQLVAYMDKTLVNNVDKTEENIKQEKCKKKQRYTQFDSRKRDDGVAIIGISCRYPNSKNPKEFWENIISGKEMISNYGEKYSRDNNEKIIYSGGELTDIDCFDANFFGINVKDAKYMDPQHRFFLECAWSAFEDAGYNPCDTNYKVGVFAGAGLNSYLYNNILLNEKKPINLLHSMEKMRIMYNCERDFLSTLVSYKLNLTGPSLNIQTACSTSLVAVHLACKSILNGECEMALAGTSTINIPQRNGYIYSEDMVFSVDGKCKAFSKDATGLVFGDGVGVVLLKSLKHAKEDGDPIYAVIRGTAINNDGANKVGFMAPSVSGQKEVIKEAINEAGFDAATIEYVETHGTGTQIGDKIEIEALKEAFGTREKNYCALGCLKNSLGHTGWNSGMAGLIKAALSIYYKKIPGNNNITNVNQELGLEDSPFYFNSDLVDWKCDRGSRRAGVSAFGLGGTNAHVILEENSCFDRKKQSSYNLNILPLSGKTPKAMLDLVEKYSIEMDEILKNDITDICFTATIGREHFKYRAAFIFEDKKDLKIQLCNFITDKIVDSDNDSKLERKVIFLFSGNGVQYTNMGKEMYRTHTIFHETINYCDSTFYRLTGEYFWDTQEKNNIVIDQIRIFSIEIAMAKMWEEMGVMPDAVLGHSLGEYAAACIAGCISIDDCIEILIKRGKILQSQGDDLGMISVRVSSEEELDNILSVNNICLSVSAINTSELFVLSGFKCEIEKLCNILQVLKKEYEVMAITTAGHTSRLEEYLPEFKTKLDAINFKQPKINVISSLDSELSIEKVYNRDYWCRHLIKPVQFTKAMGKVREGQYDVLIEVGPAPVLLGMGMEYLSDYKALYIASLRKKRSDWYTFLSSVKTLYLNGFNIEWSRIYTEGNRVHLPTYEFQGEKYWIPETEERKSDAILSENEYNWKNELYYLEWESSVLDEERRINNLENISNLNEKLLIFVDGMEEIDKCCETKKLAVFSPIFVLKGNSNKVLKNNVFMINPSIESSFDWLYEFLNQEKKYNLLYLWNQFTEDFLDESNQLHLEEMITKYMNFIYLIKKIGKSSIIKNIWVMNVFEGKGKLLLDSFLALLRVMQLEFPLLNIYAISISRVDARNKWDILEKEYQYNYNESFVLYDDTNRKILMLKEHEVDLKDLTLEFDKEGVYIITGGLGGLGKLITKWLIKCQVKNIIILGRRDISSEDSVRLVRYKEQGINIEYKQINVTDYHSLKKLFQDLVLNNKRVQGIFHTAGVVDDSTILNIERNKFSKVLPAKVIGTWNLHLLTKEFFDKIKCFVLFSSSASVIGNPGQTNHAVANAFMDSIVELRKREGLETISINWGAWENVGRLSEEKETFENILRRGFKTISKDKGIQVMEYALVNQVNKIALIPMDWSRFVNYHNLFDKKMYEEIIKKNNIIKQESGAFIEKIENLSSKERKEYIRNYLKECVKEILGILVSDYSKSLFEFGMDSLATIELKNKIQKDANISLPITFVKDNNNLDKITEYLLNLIETKDDILKKKGVREGIRSLSCQQARWLRLNQLGYGERVVPIVFNAELSRNAFLKSLVAVLKRHESLRWYFPKGSIEEVDINRIMQLNEKIFYDFSVQNNMSSKVKLVEELIRNMFKNMPSPCERISWMIKCVKLDTKKFTILLAVQHIDFDGKSISVFAREFSSYYFHYLNGRGIDLTNEVIQYSEYIQWQKNYIENEMVYDREYFKGLFSTATRLTKLPNLEKDKFGIPQIASKHCVQIDLEHWKEVCLLASRLEVSGFAILLSAYAIMIAELVKSSEVIISTIVNGRSAREFGDTIGPFTAPFPLRIQIGDLSFCEIINQCNFEVLEVNARSHYPVADLIDNIPIFNSLPQETYFSDVGINFTNYKKGTDEDNKDYKILEILGEIHFEEFKIFNQIRFKRVPGLHLVINEQKDGLAFNFYYHEKRFSINEVKKWAHRYFEILNEIVDKI